MLPPTSETPRGVKVAHPNRGYAKPMKYLITLAATAVVALASAVPALADCPQSKTTLLPSNAPIALMCSSFGPNGTSAEPRFDLRVYLANRGNVRTTAVKLQANMFDAFGTLVESWQFDEPMSLDPGTTDYDNALYGQRMEPAIQTVDHVDLYVLGVAYADGTTWTTTAKPEVGPLPGPDDHFRRS